MMKRNILYMMLAAGLLASCTNDNGGMTPGEQSSLAAFTGSIDEQPSTRAYDQTWEPNDAIGITGISGGKTYTNIKYVTKDGSGNFTVATEGEEIYYQDDNNVTFTAYYPWNDLQDGTTITADTWGQAEQKTFDFLYAKENGSKASPNVAFTFAHKMAKVVLTVKKGSDVSYDEVKEAVLSLEGFKHTGGFNVTNGTAIATGDESVEWIFAGNTEDEVFNAPKSENDGEQTVSYTLIFFPQEFDAPLPIAATFTGKQSFKANINFTEANRNAGDEQPKNEWVAGRQYNISVTLHKTKITVDGCTIAGWDEAEGGNVDAM